MRINRVCEMERIAKEEKYENRSDADKEKQIWQESFVHIDAYGNDDIAVWLWTQGGDDTGGC